MTVNRHGAKPRLLEFHRLEHDAGVACRQFVERVELCVGRLDRLDLSDSDCKMAKDMGLKLAISTDAHSARQLDYMRLGVAQARRGWLSPEDVLNTRSWRALSKLLKRN